ncbi:MAG: hypothetical protein IBX63_08845 [Coriobacteriia bacterium]|nr:hypothetical protein [Coriobacteriia bacterium]
MSGFMDILQIGGGIVLAAGYIPQIRRILATRSAHDLSLTMWLSVLVGLSLMEVYAAHLFVSAGTIAVLITNSISMAFSICMVALILTYGPRPSLRVLRPLTARRQTSLPAGVVAEVPEAA